LYQRSFIFRFSSLVSPGMQGRSSLGRRTAFGNDYYYLDEFRGAGNHRRGRPASGKARGR
jgi:hypothetical protein